MTTTARAAGPDARGGDKMIINAFLRQDTRTSEIETWYEVVDEDGETVGCFESEKEARIHAPDATIDWEEVHNRIHLAGRLWI